MGEYKKSLSHEQWLIFRKEVKKWCIDNDISKDDLAESVGYSGATLHGALSSYERCSGFLVAAITEKMEARN